MKRTLIWLTAMFLGLVLIGIFAGRNRTGTKPETSEVWPRELATPRNLICGRSSSDGANVARAVQSKDEQAVAGLLARNKALVIPQGTTVRAQEPVGGLHLVRIRSGAQIGETCWVPEGWLTPQP